MVEHPPFKREAVSSSLTERKCPLRLSARTPDFQSGERSSILLGGVFYFLILYNVITYFGKNKMHFFKRKKTFTPISRRYIRRQKIKKIALFLTLLVFAEGAFLFRKEIKYLWGELNIAHRFDWQVKQINIVAPTEYLQTEIAKITKEQQIAPGIHLTAKDAENLENTLKENIKEAKSIKVKRKFFTKELLIESEKFTPFAQISTPQDTFFMTEDGQIFQGLEEQQKGGFFNISLNAKIESETLAKELVQFIKEVKKTSLRKTDTLVIDLKGQTAQFETNYGPVKLAGFKEVKNQLSVLTEILQIAKKKNFTLPYFVDFTYFGKGKVYLKQDYKDL